MVQTTFGDPMMLNTPRLEIEPSRGAYVFLSVDAHENDHFVITTPHTLFHLKNNALSNRSWKHAFVKAVVSTNFSSNDNGLLIIVY